MKKTVKVAAAVIKEGNKILATQRGYGSYKDRWEFPGGKVEGNETAAEALVREIREELQAEIIVDRYLLTIEYDYPEFHLSMDCFLCFLKQKGISLLEHESAKWLDKETLRTVDWLEADIEAVSYIEEHANELNL